MEKKEKYNLLSAYCASVSELGDFLEAATVPGRACTMDEKGGLEYDPSFIESFIQQRFIEHLLCAIHSSPSAYSCEPEMDSCPVEATFQRDF